MHLVSSQMVYICGILKPILKLFSKINPKTVGQYSNKQFLPIYNIHYTYYTTVPIKCCNTFTAEKENKSYSEHSHSLLLRFEKEPFTKTRIIFVCFIFGFQKWQLFYTPTSGFFLLFIYFLLNF